MIAFENLINTLVEQINELDLNIVDLALENALKEKI